MVGLYIFKMNENTQSLSVRLGKKLSKPKSENKIPFN